MASRFWATSEDMSVESSTDLSVDRIDSVPRDGSSGKRGVEEVEDSLGNDSSTYTLARTMATSLSLPDRQTQEHASLLHLSLMGGRCRTQAANTVNARRRSCEQDSLPEDDSEICELSEHMFSEMKRELLKLGLISPELASKRLSDLSLYLTSFDALLNNIATRTNHDISIQQDFRSIDGSDYTISRDLSASTNPSRALVLRRESNIDRAMAEVPIDP
jgi:translation initiation factor 2-alpha kinase 3